MAANQNNLGSAADGGFLRILGIIYLVKMIRRRERRQRAGGPAQPGLTGRSAGDIETITTAS
jgi:hypothetical protein